MKITVMTMITTLKTHVIARSRMIAILWGEQGIFTTLLESGNPLLSMRTAGSMSVERAAKPIKESILSKEHNILLDEKGATLFRAAHNLRMLHKTIQSIKGTIEYMMDTLCNI